MPPQRISHEQRPVAEAGGAVQRPQMLQAAQIKATSPKNVCEVKVIVSGDGFPRARYMVRNTLARMSLLEFWCRSQNVTLAEVDFQLYGKAMDLNGPIMKKRRLSVLGIETLQITAIMCEQYKITLQDSGIEMVITLTPFHELLSVLLTHYHCVADAITFLYWHDGPSAGHYETLKPGHEIKNDMTIHVLR